jgi:aerobic-type carbon monoxide dehydrogenase small subunit (CoxS/CutS family)
MSDVIRMVINGVPVEAPPADGDMNLIDFLHERRNLTGTKLCCGIGACRACTVGTRNLPDAPMEKTLACSTPVSAMQGMYVYTVEGLAQQGTLSPLQQSFLDSFAFQCGYCAPGFLMAATAMLDHLHTYPVDAAQLDETVETWIGGNLCRCTGYVKYIEAVRKVAAAYTRQAQQHGG